MGRNNDISVNQAWEKLIKKYDILDKIKNNGFFNIKASTIKEFKEPRLMAKWDSTDSLPKILKDNKINILPTTRRSYIMSDFILYKEIPELEESVVQMTPIDIPEYESISVENINSEANAINVLVISGILNDFLKTSENVMTFNGRMGTGIFDFTVDSYSDVKRSVHVENAQCEIDGGFENEESVVIMEAKNVVHEDFHIRQLYYPYRLWKTKVDKPIRLVFVIYSNMIYRLFEYRFNSLDDYSSIELVQSKNYSLQDITITNEDLIDVRINTPIKTDDNMDFNNKKVPFIQANSMDRIISLLENMYENPMTEKEIAKLMDFAPRQSSYYFNAGKYLGLFEKFEEDNKVFIRLTSLGQTVFKLNYKKRQLKLVSLILEHKIFAELFDLSVNTGELPSKYDITNRMKLFNVCESNVIERRSSSVYGWIKWIFNLTNLS